MNKRNLISVLLLAASLSLVLAGCSLGGSDNASAAEHVETDFAPSGPLTATPTTTAVPESTDGIVPSPTPTTETGSDTSQTEIATPEPIAYVDAIVSPALDGPGFDVTVWLDVRYRGISGVDVVAHPTDEAVILESAEPDQLLGSDSLVAAASVGADGTARLAYARVGASERGDVAGVVAVLRVNAPTPEAIRAGLDLSLSFTDAGLALHGPFEAAFDLGEES